MRCGRPLAGAPGVILLALALSACSMTPTSGNAPVVARIEGIVIRNELPLPIHGVMVEVPATGGFAGCGMILRRSQCATSFPAAEYRGQAIVVRWTEYGEPHDTGEVVPESPGDGGVAPNAWVEVTIFASGQAGVRLVSDPAP